ncbi:predicted protein [Nematostella vectensis]|uniref:Uncharacterized protein n=1 Tax=Nematostella vectensis TaxID=45351 RepID=A7SJJ6_NEMVE|nr:predicted protein [Nematostella vectensis]|eukprot:XP_001628172.1 predicted protein [Nematostella vectensis]
MKVALLCGLVLACLVFVAQAVPASLRFDSSNKALPYSQYEAPWNFTTEGTFSFMFRTNTSKGALLYGEVKKGNHYLFITLDGGIALQFYLTFCLSYVTQLDIPGNFYDDQWHEVAVFLGLNEVTLTVDKILSASTECKPDIIEKEIAKERGKRWHLMYLGGIPIPSKEWKFPSLQFNYFRFYGCIGNLMYQKGIEKAFRAKLKEKVLVKHGCENACISRTQSSRCRNDGKCIDHIKTFECDCEGTGYEGKYCDQESSMVFINGSTYITYTPNQTNPYADWSMKVNQLSFRMVAKNPNGIVLYMGDREADHFLIELVNAAIRLSVNLGGGSLILQSNVTLNMSAYYWVQVTRRQRKVLLDINYGWVQMQAETPGSLSSLDLKGDSRVAYIGGGPGNIVSPLSLSKRNFSGFLQQFVFEEINVFDKILRQTDDERFKAHGRVPDGRLYRVLLPWKETTVGSGCEPGGDDDEDGDGCRKDRPTECLLPDCSPEGSFTDNVISDTERPATRPVRRLTYPTPSEGVVMSRRDAPPDHSVSPLIIVIIVIAAVIAVGITVFLLYRWNNRYSGSFKPNKGEPTDSEAEIHPARGYEQPAFYVSPNKPPKGETMA